MKLVNEELQMAGNGMVNRLQAVDMELRDTRMRLSKLYDILETGKLQLDDITPKIRELRIKQEELEITKNQIEAGMAVQGINYVDVNIVKAYTKDLRVLLEEAEFSERKAFLRSFIKRITISENQVAIHYALPSPKDSSRGDITEVLPIDTFGGDRGTVPELLFEKKELIPDLQQLIISYVKPMHKSA